MREGLSYLRNKNVEAIENPIFEENDYNKQKTTSFYSYNEGLRGVPQRCHVFTGITKGLEEVVQNAKSAWDNDYSVKGDKNNHAKVLIKFYKDENGDIRCLIANTGKESEIPEALLQQMLDFGNSKQESITNINGAGLKAFLSYCFSRKPYENGDFVVGTKKGNTLYYKTSPYSENMIIKKDDTKNMPPELREYTTFIDTRIDRDLLKELNPAEIINRLGSICGMAIQNDELEISFDMSAEVQKDIVEEMSIQYDSELLCDIHEKINNTLPKDCDYKDAVTENGVDDITTIDDNMDFETAKTFELEIPVSSLANADKTKIEIEDTTLPVSVSNIYISERDHKNKEKTKNNIPYYKEIFKTDDLWDRGTNKIGYYLFLDGFMQTYLKLDPIERSIHQSLCGCFTFVNVLGRDELNQKVTLNGIKTWFSNTKTSLNEHGEFYECLAEICKDNELFYRFIATLDTEKNARKFADTFINAMAQIYNRPFVREMPDGKDGFMDTVILEGDNKALVYDDCKNLKRNELNQMMQNKDIHARTIVEYKRDAITRQDIEQLIRYIENNGIDKTQEAYLFGLNITTDAYDYLAEVLAVKPELGMIRFGFYDAHQLEEIGFTRQANKNCLQDYALYKLYMNAQPQSEEERMARAKIKKEYGCDIILTDTMGEFMKEKINIITLDKAIKSAKNDKRYDLLFNSSIVDVRLILSTIKDLSKNDTMNAATINEYLNLAQDMFTNNSLIIEKMTEIANKDKDKARIVSSLLFGDILQDFKTNGGNEFAPVFLLKHYNDKILKNKIKEISSNYDKIKKCSNELTRDIVKNIQNDEYKNNKNAEIKKIEQGIDEFQKIETQDNIYISTKIETVKYMEDTKKQIQKFLDYREKSFKSAIPESIIITTLSNFNTYKKITGDLTNKTDIKSMLYQEINDNFYKKYITIDNELSINSEFNNSKLQERVMDSVFMDNTVLTTKEYIHSKKIEIKKEAIEETRKVLQQKRPKLEEWLLTSVSQKAYSYDELDDKTINKEILNSIKERCQKEVEKIFSFTDKAAIKDVFSCVYKSIKKEDFNGMNENYFHEKCKSLSEQHLRVKMNEIHDVLSKHKYGKLYLDLDEQAQKKICCSLACTKSLAILKKNNATANSIIFKHIEGWKNHLTHDSIER